MFNLISNSPLSDVIAPPVTTFDEFLYHWNSFTSFYQRQQNDSNQNNVNRKLTIESTNLVEKLIKIIDIIITEQLNWMNKIKKQNNDSDNQSISMICPIIEYILQNNILETLSIIAQTDTPIGIYPHILLFFIRLLNDSKLTLLPHRSVHLSINKLIILCGKIHASPYESTEIYFLTSIIKLIKNPEYLHFFTTDSFPLINSLLSLLYSEDSDISKLAGDSLIKLIQLINDVNVEKIIVDETTFSCKIIDQIIKHYIEIPPTIRLDEIENINNLLQQQQHNNNNNDGDESIQFSISIRKFLSFLKWFIFFDLIVHNIKIENSYLKQHLFDEFEKKFLHSYLLPDLLGDGYENEYDSYDNVIRSTILTSQCLRNIENTELFDLICQFLIFSNKSHQMPSILNDEKKNLLESLLKRCYIHELLLNDDGDDAKRDKYLKLSSITLQLFEDILSRPSYEIINELVLKNYSQKLKQNNSIEVIETDCTSSLNSSNDVMSKFNSMIVLDQMNMVANDIYNASIIKNKTEYIELERLIRILHLYTSLIPEELKIYDHDHHQQEERIEYEAYLKESVKGFNLFVKTCFLNWNESKLDIEESNTDANDGDENFIQIIFNNLNSLLSIPYEISIQLLSIIAKISLIPLALIDNQILNPLILTSNNNDHENLFNILHKLIADIQISVRGIDNIHVKLKIIKSQLLGQENELDTNHYNNNIDENEAKILKNLLILNEFCKELAAIIYVKNYTLKLCNDKRQGDNNNNNL